MGSLASLVVAASTLTRYRNAYRRLQFFVEQHDLPCTSVLEVDVALCLKGMLPARMQQFWHFFNTLRTPAA